VAGIVLNNNHFYPLDNGIVFDLNDYPDIDYDEFEEYVLKHFNTSFIPYFMDKYSVDFVFHHDRESNTFVITAELNEHDLFHDSALREALDDIHKKKSLKPNDDLNRKRNCWKR